ncbi:MAG: Murein hydrolase activator EnvC [Alphaproteobacteria bacterium MarineAlpha2_Bin1]|nr:MAG: Murein hydrolase activator EnvC [Alphaproteobacteria bacterium MarineAlpha2_Bin1]
MNFKITFHYIFKSYFVHILLFSLFLQNAFANEISSNALEKLKEVEQAIEQNKIRGIELTKVKSELNQDITKLRKTLLKTSLSVMNQEQIVDKISDKIKNYNSEEITIRTNLNEKKIEIDKILIILQRIQRFQLNEFQIKEDKIFEDINTSHLLSAILPQITDITDNLKSELAALDHLKKEIYKEQKNLKSAKNLMSREKIALNRLIDRKSELRGKLIIETQENKEKIKKLALNAKSLKILIKKLGLNKEKLFDKNRTLNKLDNNSFSSSKGKLPLPVKGIIKTSYGEKNRLGSRSKGLIVETIAKASVISPHEGEIVFAGPFRNYGNLLIISYGNGYHILFSGLNSISGYVGKWIMAGEPVGRMGENYKNIKPELYIELRKNGEPVDPNKWIVIKQMKVKG